MPELLLPDGTARVNKSYILKHPLTGFTSSPKMGKTQYGGVFKKETTTNDVHRIMMQSPQPNQTARKFFQKSAREKPDNSPIPLTNKLL
jgi:hypothetical protein